MPEISEIQQRGRPARQELERALRLGLGRAVELLSARPREEAAAALVSSLLDLEGRGPGRADWLLALAAELGAEEALEMFALGRIDDTDGEHEADLLLDLLVRFAREGSEAARNALYRSLTTSGLADPVLGGRQIVELDGVEGYLYAVEVLGRRIEDGDRDLDLSAFQAAATGIESAARLATRLERRRESSRAAEFFAARLEACLPIEAATPAEIEIPPHRFAPERLAEAEADPRDAFAAEEDGARRAALLARLAVRGFVDGTLRREGLFDADRRVRAVARGVFRGDEMEARLVERREVSCEDPDSGASWTVFELIAGRLGGIGRADALEALVRHPIWAERDPAERGRLAGRHGPWKAREIEAVHLRRRDHADVLGCIESWAKDDPLMPKSSSDVRLLRGLVEDPVWSNAEVLRLARLPDPEPEQERLWEFVAEYWLLDASRARLAVLELRTVRR